MQVFDETMTRIASPDTNRDGWTARDVASYIVAAAAVVPTSSPLPQSCAVESELTSFDGVGSVDGIGCPCVSGINAIDTSMATKHTTVTIVNVPGPPM